METSTLKPSWVVCLLSSASPSESSSMVCPFPSSSTSSQTTTLNSSPISTQPPRRNEGKWGLPREHWQGSTTVLETATLIHNEFLRNLIQRNKMLDCKTVQKDVYEIWMEQEQKPFVQAFSAVKRTWSLTGFPSTKLGGVWGRSYVSSW